LGAPAAVVLLVPAAPPAVAGPVAAGRPVYITNDGLGQPPCVDGQSDPCAHSIAIHAAGPAGALTQVGKPVKTGLGATGIVFAPDGRHAYAAASEEELVYVYSVQDNGALVKVGTVANDPGGPWGIAIAPNGRTVYTTNIDNGTISTFTVRADGMLERRHETLPMTLPDPKDVVVSPDGRFLFVSHGKPESPQEHNAVTRFVIHPDGTLDKSPAQVVPAGSVGAEMSITPDGRFLFVANMISDDVYGFGIGSDGTLRPVPGRKVSTPKTPEGLAVAPDGRHLYVADTASRPQPDPAQDGVWTVAIGADGAMSIVGVRTEADLGPISPTPTPDGKHLYVSDNGDGGDAPGAVTAFNLDQSTGTPTRLAAYPSLGAVPVFRSIGVLPDQGPVAAFSVQARPAGRPTVFDATSSYDRDGKVARYDWDFGDGTVLADGGPRPAHSYRLPGNYRVTLRVTDDEGCSVDFVYAGHSAYCNGSSAASAARTVTVG
jgi:6-phosphogluconolactonase (cycloisomerase 2 family)